MTSSPASLTLNASGCGTSANLGCITRSNQQNSPFFRLAPEIRNLIYKHVVIQGVIEVFPESTSDKTINALCLLSVCQQIRSEASPLFYSSNNFEIRSLRDVADFARLLKDEHRQAVRSINISIFSVNTIRIFAHENHIELQPFPLLEKVHIYIYSPRNDVESVTKAIRTCAGKERMEVILESRPESEAQDWLPKSSHYSLPE